jgi:hypothetical protein
MERKGAEQRDEDDLPQTLAEAAERFVAAMSPEAKARLREVTDDELFEPFENPFLLQADVFGLLSGRNPALFVDCGAVFGESAPEVVLKAAWNVVHGHPPRHHLKKLHGEFRCPECGRRDIAFAWDEARLSRRMSQPCDGCRAFASATADRRRAESARVEADARFAAEANARFVRASRLGALCHEAFCAEAARRGLTGPTDEAINDASRIAVARARFEAEAEFRALWSAVRESATPGKADAAWLALWRTP